MCFGIYSYLAKGVIKEENTAPRKKGQIYMLTRITALIFIKHFN